MNSIEPEFELCGISREIDFDFSKNTSYGLGGFSKAAYFPETEQDAVRVFNALQKAGEKFVVLGKGSNVLVSDKYFNGVVISTSRLKGVYRTEEDRITCLSGTTVVELLKFCQNIGLSGLEFLAGIPASIGGLSYMNGGAAGKYISDVLLSVALYDGKLRNFSNKLCNFGYKYSTMRNINCIILSCSLKVTPSSPEKVKDNIDKILLSRRVQPKGRSCGCVFKNPDGLSAGKLIDECSLKGISIGGAKVSLEHANFIINEGASAAEVYSLIQFVKSRVLEMTGVSLEEEVVYIGDFNDSFS